LSKRLNPTTLVISEVVFGILLTAVAVQLAVSGLSSLGIIAPVSTPLDARLKIMAIADSEGKRERPSSKQASGH
jgi:hypothetical protein